MTTHDESLLVARVRDGDSRAFATVVEAYLQGVQRFAYTIIGSIDRADDVAQTAFIHLWEHRASLDCARPLKPYLFRMTRNLALNERRDHAVHARYHEQLQADMAAGVMSTVVHSFEGRVLNAATMAAALRQLSERRRLAIQLRFDSQLTHAEIGEVLQISTRAAENLVFHALEDLRKFF